MVEQELRDALPSQIPVATVLTMVEVDVADPAFAAPSKLIAPLYSRSRRSWALRQDGEAWRQVVPSPRPIRVVDQRPIRLLLEQETVVICAGGGGIPVADRRLERATPRELRRYSFPAGSMGPKVEAACDFVESTGRRAVIGA